MNSTASKFVDISLQPTCLLGVGELNSSQGSDIFEALFFRILHFWRYIWGPEKKVKEKDTKHDLFMLRNNHLPFVWNKWNERVWDNCYTSCLVGLGKLLLTSKQTHCNRWNLTYKSYFNFLGCIQTFGSGCIIDRSLDFILKYQN